MPGWFAGMIPARPDDINEAAAQWLRTNSAALRLAGTEAGSRPRVCPGGHGARRNGRTQ